jgi:hypothetical protein
MNTTNCPAGFATDQIMKCSMTNPPACDANLYAYIGVMSSLTTIRFIFSIYQWFLWTEREAIRAKQHNEILAKKMKRRGKQLPVAIILSAFTVIMFIVFTTLTCLDIVGCYGPFNPVLCYFIFWIPVNIANTIYFRRLARLNRVLSPLIRAKLNDTTTPDDRQPNHQQQQQHTVEDIVMSILIIISFLGLGGFDIVWLIVAPILGPGQQLPIDIGMIFLGIFNCTFSITYCWQLEGLIQVARNSGNRDARINAAVFKLRNSQRIFFVIGVGFGLIWFLVGIQVIEFSYIIIMIHMSAEVLSGILFAIRSGGGHKSSNATKSTSNNKNHASNKNNKNQVGSTFLAGTISTTGNNNNNNQSTSSINVNNNGSVVIGVGDGT